jgi:hypothetical protein
MEMLDASPPPPSGHLRTGSNQSQLKNELQREHSPRRGRTDLGSDYPTSAIISLLASLVKHLLPKFFVPAAPDGIVKSIISNLTPQISASNYFSFLQSDKAKETRFALGGCACRLWRRRFLCCGLAKWRH